MNIEREGDNPPGIGDFDSPEQAMPIGAEMGQEARQLRGRARPARGGGGRPLPVLPPSDADFEAARQRVEETERRRYVESQLRAGRARGGGGEHLDLLRRQVELAERQAQAAEAIRDAETDDSPEAKRKRLYKQEENVGKVIEIDGLDSFSERLNPREEAILRTRFGLYNGRAAKQATNDMTELAKNIGPEHVFELKKSDLHETIGKYGRVAEAVCVYVMDIGGGDEDKRQIKRVVGSSLMSVGGVDDLREHRDNVRGYLAANYGLTPDQASEYEKIAYNFVMNSHEVEANDEHGRLMTREMANFFLANLMYPNNAALNAARANKKAWPPNKMGQWMARHFGGGRARRILRVLTGGAVSRNKVPLPEKTIKSFLDYTKLDKKTSLKSVILKEGRKMMVSPGSRADLDFQKLQSDKPFMSYGIGQLSPACVYASGIINAEYPKEKNEVDIGDAMSRLGLDKKYRKTVVYLIVDRVGLRTPDAKHNPQGWLKIERRVFAPNTRRLGYSLRSFWKGYLKVYPRFFK